MNAEPTENPLAILVVDDELMIAMFLEDVLLDLGCKVVGPAAVVAPALALIQVPREPVDGAFLDVNLRGELVYPVADALIMRDVPFVFVTGYSVHGIDPRYVAIPTLPKPIPIDKIGDVVRSFEKRRRARLA